MSLFTSTRYAVLAVCLPLVLLLSSCCLSPEIVKVPLPPDMTRFKDAGKKLDFQLPPGWQPAPVDPVIEKSTKGVRRFGDPVGFHKGDKGTFAVWCNKHNPDRTLFLNMADAVDAYAPLHELFTCFEADSPGSGFLSRPQVCSAPATRVVKGEKKEFLIVTVIKDTPASAALKECEYIVLGSSSASAYNEEIKADITVVAVTLNNSGE